MVASYIEMKIIKIATHNEANQVSFHGLKHKHNKNRIQETNLTRNTSVAKLPTNHRSHKLPINAQQLAPTTKTTTNQSLSKTWLALSLLLSSTLVDATIASPLSNTKAVAGTVLATISDVDPSIIAHTIATNRVDTKVNSSINSINGNTTSHEEAWSDKSSQGNIQGNIQENIQASIRTTLQTTRTHVTTRSEVSSHATTGQVSSSNPSSVKLSRVINNDDTIDNQDTNGADNSATKQTQTSQELTTNHALAQQSITTEHVSAPHPTTVVLTTEEENSGSDVATAAEQLIQEHICPIALLCPDPLEYDAIDYNSSDSADSNTAPAQNYDFTGDGTVTNGITQNSSSRNNRDLSDSSNTNVNNGVTVNSQARVHNDTLINTRATTIVGVTEKPNPHATNDLATNSPVATASDISNNSDVGTNNNLDQDGKLSDIDLKNYPVYIPNKTTQDLNFNIKFIGTDDNNAGQQFPVVLPQDKVYNQPLVLPDGRQIDKYENYVTYANYFDDPSHRTPTTQYAFYSNFENFEGNMAFTKARSHSIVILPPIDNSNDSFQWQAFQMLL